MGRIGILGGSFNPPHKAHRAMAVSAAEQYKLDTVYFLPTAHPPHKDEKELAEDEHRIRMIRMLIDGMKDDTFCVSDMELTRGGISYTHQTLKECKKKHPDDELFFIIGGDSLADFHKWKKPEKIASLATILAVPREDMSMTATEKLCKKQGRRFDGTILPVSFPKKYRKISSTDIRNRISGTSKPGLCSHELPGRIERYIRLHGLYGAEKPVYEQVPDEKELKKDLRATLRPKRYRHTLGVADTAEQLGKIYQAGDPTLPERARLAGLLHDCAKYYSDREQLELCDRHGIFLTKTEWICPALIHGKLGAWLAENRYGVRDEEILSAIRLHTVGRPAMTTLEKIVYIADYIEPGREIPTALHPLEGLRNRVNGDLDGVLVDVIENTIDYLKKNDRVIDEASWETWKYYTKKEGRGQ